MPGRQAALQCGAYMEKAFVPSAEYPNFLGLFIERDTKNLTAYVAGLNFAMNPMTVL